MDKMYFSTKFDPVSLKYVLCCEFLFCGIMSAISKGSAEDNY